MPTQSSERSGRAWIALLAAAVLACLSGCKKSGLANGPLQEPAALPKAWPQGHSEPLKITDQLTLSIPLAYVRSAIYHGKPTRALLTVQSDRAEAQFEFFLPGFTGYTLDNYRAATDPNKVEVVYLHAGDPHEAQPDAAGEYPPNMLKRALTDFLNPNDYKDQYGLRCYRDRTPSGRLTCYGKRDDTEDILLYSKLAPYAQGDTFPLLQARYFSKRYGGVRIAWRTHVDNLPHWHDIDAQIWKFIDAWQVTQPAPATGTAPQGARPGDPH